MSTPKKSKVNANIHKKGSFGSLFYGHENVYCYNQSMIPPLSHPDMKAFDETLAGGFGEEEVLAQLDKVLQHSWGNHGKLHIFRAVLSGSTLTHKNQKKAFDQLTRRFPIKANLFNALFDDVFRSSKSTQGAMLLLGGLKAIYPKIPNELTMVLLGQWLGKNPHKANAIAYFYPNLLSENKGAAVKFLMEGILSSPKKWSQTTYQKGLLSLSRCFDFPPETLWLMQKQAHLGLIKKLCQESSPVLVSENLLPVLVDTSLVNPDALLRSLKMQHQQNPQEKSTASKKVEVWLKYLSSLKRRNQLNDATQGLVIKKSLSRPRL